MNLSSLKPAEGSVKNKKRVGRGQGSGRGGTSTRGHKGAKSRSGYSRKVGFEGGQMPLFKRVPKFGFKNNNKIVYKAINLSSIEELVSAKNIEVVTLDVLLENGLINKSDKVKVLGQGELKSKVKVSAHAFSTSAKDSIEKVGGNAEILN